mmetsp:Transcript_4444/g.8645  ORF Transcript_4444/g.8645 Transcript_4444/m.8645 type:complete len:133 (-) Transcript_4444:156-554(-)
MSTMKIFVAFLFLCVSTVATANMRGAKNDNVLLETERKLASTPVIYQSVQGGSCIILVRKRQIQGIDFRLIKKVTQESCILRCSNDPKCLGLDYDGGKSICKLWKNLFFAPHFSVASPKFSCYWKKNQQNIE